MTRQDREDSAKAAGHAVDSAFAVACRRLGLPVESAARIVNMIELEPAPIRCIVCKKAMKNIFSADEDNYNQPNDGLTFSTIGQYGSTVFDPMDSTFLEITVCDPCITQAGADGDVLFHFPRPAPPRGHVMKWPLKRVEGEAAI